MPITVQPGESIQAALDAAITSGEGDVFLASGSHTFSQTLSLRAGIVSLRGKGVQGPQLRYTGDPTRPAIQVDAGVWYADIGGFSLRGPGRGANNGIGIRACRDEGTSSGSGTVCGSNGYEDIIVVGFGVGVQLGEINHTSTSENRFRRLSVFECTAGVVLTDWNTLNNHFQDLNLSLCTIGLVTSGGGAETHIDGGAAGQMGDPDLGYYEQGVFYFSSGGTYSVKRYRQGEGGTARFLGMSGSSMQVSVSNCTVLGTQPANGWVADVHHHSSLLLTGCALDGHVLCGSVYGSVTAVGCSTSRDRLFIRAGSPPYDFTGSRVRQTGCDQYLPDGQRVYLPDGLVTA